MPQTEIHSSVYTMSGDLTLNDLTVTERTVEHHVENIMAKLGVLSRTEIGVWAVGHGLRLLPRTAPSRNASASIP
jgi:hypothetical protein